MNFVQGVILILAMFLRGKGSFERMTDGNIELVKAICNFGA